MHLAQALPAALSFAVLSYGALTQAGSDDLFFYNAEASLFLDDNVTRAQNPVDIREDSVVEGKFGFGTTDLLSQTTSLIYSANASYHAFSEFDGLNAFTLQGAVKYNFAFSKGFLAPLYSVNLSVTETLADSAIRDSTKLDLSFQLSKWFTEQTSTLFGIGLTSEEAEGDVFDQQRLRVFANVDLLFTRRWTGFLTLIYVDGDVVSTALPTTAIANVADAIEPDDAFGAGRLAYRLDATSVITTLGLNYRLEHGKSLDFTARSLSAKTAWGINYDDLVLRASYLVSFK